MQGNNGSKMNTKKKYANKNFIEKKRIIKTQKQIDARDCKASNKHTENKQNL